MNKVAVAVTPNAVVIAAPIAAEASDVAQEPPSGRSTRKATQLKRIVGAADGTPANASLGGLPLPRVQPLDLTKKRKFDAAPSRGAAPTRKQRRLAFVCNMRPQNAQTQGPDDEFEEFDSPATIQALANLFGREGYIVSILEADRTLPRRLANGHFDLVFNMAEGKGGRCREALVPALCELLGLAYTGSDPLTFAATLDKAVAKRLIASEVATPRWLLARNIADLAQFDLAFPVLPNPTTKDRARASATTANAAISVNWSRGSRICSSVTAVQCSLKNLSAGQRSRSALSATNVPKSLDLCRSFPRVARGRILSIRCNANAITKIGCVTRFRRNYRLIPAPAWQKRR